MDNMELYRRPRTLVLPELVSLGMFVTDVPRFGGTRPDGQDGFEIGYIATGCIEWWTGTDLIEAGPGTIVIDPPGSWQGGQSAIVHPCRRYWLRCNLPPTGELPGLTPDTIDFLRRLLNDCAVTHFPAIQQFEPMFVRLLEQQRAPAEFAEDLSRLAFHQILLSVAQDYLLSTQDRLSPPVRRAIAYLEEHLESEVKPTRLRDVIGPVPGNFHELFLRETKMTFAKYQTKLRITAAKKKLIETDLQVTEIAMLLGFSTSQYFATAFRRLVGMSPSVYRALRQSRENSRAPWHLPLGPEYPRPGPGWSRSGAFVTGMADRAAKA